MDVAKRINILRFRWLGHVVRMDEDAPPKRDDRRQGRLRTLWKDQVGEALTSLGKTN